MGYYSDIKLVTNTKGMERLKRNMSTINIDLDQWADRVVPSGYADFTLVVWKSRKWYPEFPEINILYFTLAQMKEDRIPYRYVRIGEDLNEGDIDTRYFDPEGVLPAMYADADIVVENLDDDYMYLDDRQAMCDAVLQMCKTVEYGRFVRKIEYNPELVNKPVRVYQKNGFCYDCDATPESILQEIKEYYKIESSEN